MSLFLKVYRSLPLFIKRFLRTLLTTMSIIFESESAIRQRPYSVGRLLTETAYVVVCGRPGNKNRERVIPFMSEVFQGLSYYSSVGISTCPG